MAAPVPEAAHLPVLITLGAVVFAGTIGARVFQWLRIPQVVGYIAIGILLGHSGFGIIDAALMESLRPLTFFSLGIIGFLIGEELHRDVFKRHGRQLFTILVAEGVGAFLVTALGAGIVMYLLTGSLAIATAVGLVLGAISSATAPAATVDVLWEYKSMGTLTTTILAIVALDDALALALFSIASAFAGRLLGSGEVSLLTNLLHSGYELGGGIGLGVLGGLALNFLLRWMADHEKSLTLTVGILSLVIGAAILLGLDLIIAAMTLGAVLVNLAPNRSHEARQIIERFAPPVYVLFFVFVGARLQLRGIPAWAWMLAGVYVVSRTVGKFTGVYVGARLTKASDKIRKYLGFCLFSQAGVAIGLAIVASLRFADYRIGEFVLGDLIVMVVTATTFMVQIIGPPFVKFGIFRAGEAGLKATEEDILKTVHVQALLDTSVPAFAEESMLSDVLPQLSQTDATSYPVLDTEHRMVGIVNLTDIKDYLGAPEMAQWTVTYDLMRPAPDALNMEDTLMTAVSRMRELDFETLPVNDAEGKYLGMIGLHAINRRTSEEVVRMHARAEME